MCYLWFAMTLSKIELTVPKNLILDTLKYVKFTGTQTLKNLFIYTVSPVVRPLAQGVGNKINSKWMTVENKNFLLGTDKGPETKFL